jgi:hypothetical protein
MMKSMAAGGGVEMVTEIHRISVNPAPQEARTTADLPSASASGIAPAMSSGAAAATVPARDGPVQPGDRDLAEQSCLQEKVAAAQAAQKKKRGLGSLLNAASRAAGLLGKQDVAQAAGDIGSAGATVDDLASAARDLGLTEDEIASCRRPAG